MLVLAAVSRMSNLDTHVLHVSGSGSDSSGISWRMALSSCFKLEEHCADAAPVQDKTAYLLVRNPLPNKMIIGSQSADLEELHTVLSCNPFQSAQAPDSSARRTFCFSPPSNQVKPSYGRNRLLTLSAVAA
jgi:hypothetical protein